MVHLEERSKKVVVRVLYKGGWSLLHPKHDSITSSYEVLIFHMVDKTIFFDPHVFRMAIEVSVVNHKS